MAHPGPTDARTGSGPVAVLAEVVFWWAVAYAVWLMSLSAAPLQELLVGAAASLPCGVAAYGARRATGDRWVLHRSWLRPALRAPLAMVTDTVTVLASALTGKPAGGFWHVATGAVDDAPPARSQRAVATFWLSLTPGSYAVDSDPSDGRIMIHTLAGRGPSMADAGGRPVDGEDG